MPQDNKKPERLWDTTLADRAAAMDQALKLGGVVVRPPKRTGFGDTKPEPDEPR